MAYADKTYINKEQYILVKKWWLKTRKKQKRELGDEIWMYPFQFLKEETYDNGYDNPPTIHYDYDPSESDLDIENMSDDCCVWNTSTKQNFWIAKNCPFDFIQEQIRAKLFEGYDDSLNLIPDELMPFHLIDKMKFNNADYVMSISDDNTSIYFWEEDKEDKTKLLVFTEMLVYGTTFLYKLIYDFKRVNYTNFDYKVNFMYCGLGFIYENGKTYYIDDNNEKLEVRIAFFDFSKLKLPKFKHSYKRKDCDKYSPNEILLSMEDNVHDMGQYKDNENKKRLLLQLPRYINDQLT